jgi:PPOX class probable F420-dependent enzyme
MELDTTTEFGARVARRLRDEAVIWLTTVDADGTPQPSPVWFWWDGTTLLIYSQPNAPKMKNIAANPRVALHFDSDGAGGDIVVLTGEAVRADPAPPITNVPAYLEKYREGIKGLGMTPERMAEVYSAAIHITPHKLRGH